MDQLRSLMQSALAQRLAEHLRAEVAPVANIPNLRTASVQDRLVGGLRLGTLAPRDLLDTLGLAREGIDYGAKALTGLGALETQKIQQIDNPVLRNAANAGSFLLPGGPITSILALATEAGRDHLPSPVGPTDARNAGAAFDQAQGNVVSRLRQANEGFAQDSPLAAGIFNQLYNPLTYLTGGGTAEERALQQSGRISRGLNIDLNTVNGILYPEGHLIGKASSAILGPAVRGVLDRTGLNDILRQRYDLPAAPEAGDLARYLEPQGLPVPDKVPNEPSPLVRDKAPNVLAMARLEAARSKAAAQPALFDLQTTGGQLPRLFDDRLQATGDPLGELVAQVAPPPAPPPPVQPIADLLGAARRVAQPNRLEQLLGAARKVFPEGAGTPLTAAKQASADLAPPAATPRADPLGLMRDLLKSGDNGKGMVYAPADPQFWSKRVGANPAAVPGLLRQLQDEGSLAPDHTGDLLNTYLAGGDRTPVAPDLPGGSLELPAMPDYPNMTRAEAIGNLTPAEVGQLVELAYRNPVARRKALLAHPNPADVASAALDRIEGNNDLMRNLHVWNPDLAGKLTYLPEPDTGGGDFGLMARLKGTPQTPEERAAWQARYAGQSQAGTDILAQGDRVAGSAVTQADLNALSPEERVAALRKLTAEPEGLTPQPRPGPGGIAGWLTRPLTTGPGVTRLGVAGSGGLIGAAAGGLAPAESEDQRRIHALQGAAVGAGLGLGTTTKAGQNIVSSLPVAGEFTGNLIRAANVAQREAMDRSNKGITFHQPGELLARAADLDRPQSDPGRTHRPALERERRGAPADDERQLVEPGAALQPRQDERLRRPADADDRPPRQVGPDRVHAQYRRGLQQRQRVADQGLVGRRHGEDGGDLRRPQPRAGRRAPGGRGPRRGQGLHPRLAGEDFLDPERVHPPGRPPRGLPGRVRPGDAGGGARLRGPPRRDRRARPRRRVQRRRRGAGARAAGAGRVGAAR
jgi:hypothetical protein